MEGGGLITLWALCLGTPNYYLIHVTPPRSDLPVTSDCSYDKDQSLQWPVYKAAVHCPVVLLTYLISYSFLRSHLNPNLPCPMTPRSKWALAAQLCVLVPGIL